MAKKRIGNSFTAAQLNWMARVFAAVSNTQGVEVSVLRELARASELSVVYQKVLRMKRKLEEM